MLEYLQSKPAASTAKQTGFKPASSPCFVLCAGSGDQWKQEINKLSHDGSSGKTDMRFTVCARAFEGETVTNPASIDSQLTGYA